MLLQVYRHSSFRTGAAIAFLVVLFVLTFFFPPLFEPLFTMVKDSFVSIHLLFEMTAIFTSFSIALYGWISIRHMEQEVPPLLPAFFFAVAVFDLFHAFTFMGMPEFFGEVTSLNTTWFWTIARLTEAIVFLVSAALLSKKRKRPGHNLFLLAAAYTVFVSYMIFSDSFFLPPLLGEDGPNQLKVMLETTVAILHLAAIFVLFRQVNRERRNVPGEFFIASVAIIFASIYFMSYSSTTDFLSLSGHIFKAIGYVAIMRVVYFRNIEEPFLKIKLLHDRNRSILNTVDIGMIETDANGMIRFLNIPAKLALQTSDQQGLGKSVYEFNAEGENVHDFTTMKRTNGDPFPAEVERFPLMEKGRVTGYVYTMRDLTDAIRQEEMEKEQQQLEFELQTAAAVQNSLLQSSTHNQHDHIGVISIPYRQLNGDFYDINVTRNYTLFSVADVSGKGIPAAIQMSMITYAMEQSNPMIEEPHEVLGSLNTFVSRYTADTNFITMFICFFNELTGELAYSSGGHEPALVYRAATGEIEELQTKGAGLGFIETPTYETRYTRLLDGDFVVLYTDGISEDRGREDVDSPDILKEGMRHADRRLPARIIAEQLLAYVQANKIAQATDDQTIAVLKKQPAEQID